jgi:hypothetical protein
MASLGASSKVVFQDSGIADISVAASDLVHGFKIETSWISTNTANGIGDQHTAYLSVL